MPSWVELVLLAMGIVVSTLQWFGTRTMDRLEKQNEQQGKATQALSERMERMVGQVATKVDTVHDQLQRMDGRIVRLETWRELAGPRQEELGNRLTALERRNRTNGG